MRATAETTPAVWQDRAIVAPGESAGGINVSGKSRWACALAMFISVFLLFQVQLLRGKEILPLFGGAPAVWTACVLVFQILFLAGYGYSHGIVTWLPLRRQVRV